MDFFQGNMHKTGTGKDASGDNEWGLRHSGTVLHVGSR